MATEEEAREATDEQEVQVAVDLGTAHLQTHLDSKLPFNKEIKDESKTMDSTEGILKIPEDQVLVEAPSEVKIPLELGLNGTTSLNGHMDKEDDNPNGQPHENGQKDKEQVENLPDGTNTHQSNRSINEEAIDSLGHRESAGEHSSLLKQENEEPKEHGQQELEGDVMDDKMVQEDTLKTDNAAEPTAICQQDQNLESAKAAEDTHPAKVSNILDDVTVVEAPVGVQTPLDPNVNNSNVLVDAIDGNTGPVEPAKADDATHLDHNDSSPNDKDSAEHANEVATLQQSKQTDAMDADVVQEEIPKSTETEVQEEIPKSMETEMQEEIPRGKDTEVHKEMPKTVQAVEFTIDAQVLDKELLEESNDSAYEETEVIPHQSSVAVSEETAPEQVAMTEPAVNFQDAQNQGPAEEMKDSKAVDTDKTTQHSSADFEEQIPEDPVVTTTPSSDIHVHNVESEEFKDLEDAKQSGVASAEDAVQDKEALPSEPVVDIQPLQGLEQVETENTGSEEMDAAYQTHAVAHSNLAQEYDVGASESHVTELAEDVKDIETTETQEVTHHSIPSEPHNDDIQKAMEQDSVNVKDTEATETQGISQERFIYTSEDTVEDNVTAPTCDTQEVQCVESPEEIKDDIAENIKEALNTTTVDEEDLESNVLTSEAIPEQQRWGLEPEEIKNTKPVEIEVSDQRHASLFNDPAQEDNTTEDEIQKMELAGDPEEIEAAKIEAIPLESRASISEEPTPEDNITECERSSDNQEVNDAGSTKDIEGIKGTESEEISGYSKETFAVEAAEGNNALESETNADIQPVQEVGSKEVMNTEFIVESGTFHQIDDAVIHEPTQEDNPSESELHIMESSEVSNTEAIEVQQKTHQTSDVQSEEQETEENTRASEAQILKPESVEEIKDTDATEPQGISQERIICISEEFVPEENVTEKEPGYDNKEVQNEETELIKEHDDVKAQQISNQSTGAIVREADQENSFVASEQTNDVQVKGHEAEEIKNTEDVGTEENPHQTHVAAVEQNLIASEQQMNASSQQMNSIETTRPESTLDESNIASLEEKATEENAIIGPEVDIQKLQKQESVQFKDTEASEPQGISPSNIVSAPEKSTSEDNVTTTEPCSASQAENLELAEVIRTPQEHEILSETTIDVPPGQETEELAETNKVEPVETPHIITSGLPLEEVKGTEAMETEPTASALDDDSQQVLEQESVEDMKCAYTTEYQGESQQSHISISDQNIPTEENTTVTEPTCDTQIHNDVAQEIKENEDDRIEEFSGGGTFSSPVVVPQESDVQRSEPDSDARQVLEQSLTEETRGSEAAETEDHQQHRISTFEKRVPEQTVTESAPRVDEQQLQEEKSAVEVKDIEAMETKEIPDHSNTTTSENAAHESIELQSDPDKHVQPAWQLELAEDSKDSQLVKAEETEQSNFATLEEPAVEDNAANEIGSPADIKQEHELKSVLEIKDIDATKAEEASHKSQVAALEEPPSESNIETTEPTYNIQKVNDLEATKQKSIEDTNDKEIFQQDDIAALEDQSLKDNEVASEELPVDSNEENLGNEINNKILVHEKIKDETQESTELKDEASNLGEKAVFTTQIDENITDVEAVQSSRQVAIETSHNIDQIKEEPKAVTEHDSTKLSSDQHEENIAHVQDRDIKGEILTESGKEEVTQASVEPQASQDVAEDDTIKSSEQANDQHQDLVLQMQLCERSIDDLAIGQQDEDLQKVNVDQQKKEGEEIEEQTEEIKTDEQKHDDNNTDFTTVSLMEPRCIEVFTNKIEDTVEAERTETMVTEMLKNENTLHATQESIPRTTDVNAENITERKEGTEEENETNNACRPLDADKENCIEDEPKNTGKDEQCGAIDEIRDEEVRNVTENIEMLDKQEPLNIQGEPDLSSYVEKDLQEISDLAPSNDEKQENLEPEENGFDKTAKTEITEKMETSYTTATEAVKFDEDICDKATRADELSDENLKAFQDTRRDPDVSSVVTKPQRESLNEDMEDHELALSAQPTLDENTTKQASGLEATERELLLPEQLLPAETEEQKEDQITTGQYEEGMHEAEIVNAQEEAEESDLPVSNFLMSLILAKESNDPNGNPESEAEKKQDETTKNGSCLITSRQEESPVSFPSESNVDDKFISEQEKQNVEGESLVSLPAESNVDDKFISEQEKQNVEGESLVSFPEESNVDDKFISEQEKPNVEGSEKTHETFKEQSHDFNLGTVRSLEIDEELNRKNHDSEAPVYQDDEQDEISKELVSGEAAGLVTEMETRDFELDEKTIDTICQKDVEARTQIEEGSLNRNLGDSTSPKASQENTFSGGRSELLHESLPEDSSDAVAEQTLSLTEPDMGDAEKLPNNTHGLQNPLPTEQEESDEDSIVEGKSTIEVQLESEGVNKKEEDQHANTGGATEEQIENLHDSLQKSRGSEAISDEQAPEIVEPVSGTNINLVHTTEVSAGSTCMDEKENYSFSNNEKALEIQPDGSNLQINQDNHERNNLLDKPGECNLQEQHDTDAAQKSPKEPDEGCQKSLAIKEPVTKEENAHEKVESHMQPVNIKPNEEQEANLQVQERGGLDAVSPKEAPEVDESFVKIKKQEFSTDEEQSPKADEANMAEGKICDEKTKDEEADKNSTDEATMKIEERGTGQKASPKKHNILSGVGSKVKHQLAKVKKAIIGKPGHTKSESPKS